MKLKKIVTITKGLRKKIEINIVRTKLKNIIPSIWMKKWNWKPIKVLQKDKEKKLEIQRIGIKLKNIILGKLGLNVEIENK